MSGNPDITRGFRLYRFLTKLKSAVHAAVAGEPRFRWQEACWFLIIGVWLGFIVLDGATYVLLALVLAVRLPLMEANAVKSFLLVPTTAVAIQLSIGYFLQLIG